MGFVSFYRAEGQNDTKPMRVSYHRLFLRREWLYEYGEDDADDEDGRLYGARSHEPVAVHRVEHRAEQRRASV